MISVIISASGVIILAATLCIGGRRCDRPAWVRPRQVLPGRRICRDSLELVCGRQEVIDLGSDLVGQVDLRL
jgi:hypothetical protein